MTAGRSLLLSLQNAYETLFTSVPTVVDALRGGVTQATCDERLEAWASRVVANAEMMISVHGREHIDPTRTYLVMSNHQSHYDVAVVFYVLGSAIRMVAKRELFDVPVFGRALRASGFIAVDRSNTRSAIASLEDAKKALARGIPIWIAPEGRRSPSGELLPFKKGGFVLALTTGFPVLPMSIRGTRDVLPAGGLRSRRGVEIFVTIHPPIDPRRYAPENDSRAARDALAGDVRRAIESGL